MPGLCDSSTSRVPRRTELRAGQGHGVPEKALGETNIVHHARGGSCPLDNNICERALKKAINGIGGIRCSTKPIMVPTWGMFS